MLTAAVLTVDSVELPCHVRGDGRGGRWQATAHATAVVPVPAAVVRTEFSGTRGARLCRPTLPPTGPAAARVLHARAGGDRYGADPGVGRPAARAFAGPA